jgi:uncharacterized protein involved in exopolysaccharide biosynthesis
VASRRQASATRRNMTAAPTTKPVLMMSAMGLLAKPNSPNSTVSAATAIEAIMSEGYDALNAQLELLQSQRVRERVAAGVSSITADSTAVEKITLFRRLFAGRCAAGQ